MIFAILQIEDNENDILFLRRAFQKAQVPNPLYSVRSGRQAVEYLSGIGDYADREKYPMPCLVLLDLKMPGMFGLEVLKWIREQPEFKMLIVLILTSSAEPVDVEQAYRLGANSYLVKPLSLEETFNLIQFIKTIWLTHNVPPPGCKEIPAHHVA
jgi:CheY-like chemotaxis protein